MTGKSLYTRLLEGYEQNGEGARYSSSKTRYQVCKDLMTGHMKEVVKINLLMLLFFTPRVVVLVLSFLYADTNAVLYPFGANLGMGYPAVPDLQGTAQWLAVESGLYTCIGILLSSVIACVGLAGGMYAIRNLIWTEGVFVAKDFWRGVKLNYKNATEAATFFCVVLLLSVAAVNVAEFNIAMGAEEVVLLRICQVACYVTISIAALMTLWMIALGANYKTNFLEMLKNSFLLMVGTILQTVFFAAVALLPFALFFIGEFGGFLSTLAMAMLALFSFSFALLVWLSFAQWVFDRYINPKLTSAKQDNVINKNGSPALTGDDSASVLEYQRAIVAEGVSRLLSTPIKPIQDGMEAYALPEEYTRADLKKLKENKEALAADAEAYEKEHENDPRYVEYRENFAARERALAEQEKKDKKDKKKKK